MTEGNYVITDATQHIDTRSYRQTNIDMLRGLVIVIMAIGHCRNFFLQSNFFDPMSIVCAYVDKWHGWLKDTLVMFGRVPLAFYVVHWYLLHTMAVIYGVMTGFEAHQFLHFFSVFPDGHGTNLFGGYGLWLLVIVIMHPFCKWMAKVKQTRKDWWLSYL